MPYYKTCEECGTNLDPQERCDCQASSMQTGVIPLPWDDAGSAQRNMLDEYGQHLADISMRPNTVKTYLAEVNRLNRYLSQTYGLDISKPNDLSAVTSLQILGYHDALTAGSHRRKTRSLYTIAIKSFFGYHFDTGNICDNPFESLPHLKSRYIEPDSRPDESRFYTKDIIETVVRHLREQMHKNCKKRDLALFALLCASAMRINEACCLNVKDMETIRKGWVYVAGKGGQREQVDVASYGTHYIDLYLQTREGLTPEEPLFLSQKGGRLTENAAWKAFSRFQKPLGIPTGTHICRHTALTHIAHDAGVLVARDAARHKDVKTTNNYIHRMHDLVVQTAEESPIARAFAHVEKGA